MFKSIAVCMALMLMAAGLTQARPFTAKDLALLERVSDPRISPDARFVAYNLRSTDWDGNHGVNALWVIDRSAANSAPRLVRDQEKSSTAPRWSGDGQWLYFLSSRSGSTQVWRTAAQGGESWQVTKLPLDVSQYRFAPDGHTLVAPNAIPWRAARPKTRPRQRRKPAARYTTPPRRDSGTRTLTAATSVCLRFA